MQIRARSISSDTLSSIVSTLPRARRRVYRALLDWGPLTMEQVGEYCAMKHSSYSPRINELRRMGLVKIRLNAGGKPELRDTSQKHKAELYEAVTDDAERVTLREREFRAQRVHDMTQFLRLWSRFGGSSDAGPNGEVVLVAAGKRVSVALNRDNQIERIET